MKQTFIFSLFLLSTTLLAKWDSKNNLGLELREFNENQDESQIERNIALTGQINSKYQQRHSSVHIKANALFDFYDTNRNRLNIQNLYYQNLFSSYTSETEDDQLFEDEIGIELDSIEPETFKKNVSFVFGFRVYEWTNNKKFSPADTINAHIFDETFENPEKKGEFTISLARQWKNAKLTGFLLPRAELPFHPKPHSRLSLYGPTETSLIVKNNNNLANEQSTLQSGLRYEYFGKLKYFSFHFLQHIDTEAPLFAVDEQTSAITALYFETNELGFTSQFEWNKYQFNIEAVHKSYYDYDLVSTAIGQLAPKNHTLISLGSHGQFNLKSKKTLIAFAELQKVLGLSKEQSAEQYLFQSDVYLGLKLDFNNQKETALTFGAIKDFEKDSENIFELDLSTRISKKMRFSSLIRLIDATPKTDPNISPLQRLHNTNFLKISIISNI